MPHFHMDGFAEWFACEDATIPYKYNSSAHSNHFIYIFSGLKNACFTSEAIVNTQKCKGK